MGLVDADPATTYADHLRGLPCYWINLTTSTDRAKQFTEKSAPLFGEATRVDAVTPDRVTDKDLDDFITAWRRSVDHIVTHVNDPEARRLHLGSVPKPRSSRDLRRIMLALTRSHLNALQRGLADGHPRFCVAEDDVVPRHTVWDSSVSAPPTDSDIAVHSGALRYAAHRQDDALFTKGRSHEWRPIKKPLSSLCAGLYEVTPAGAEAIIRACETFPMMIDHSWGFALRECRSTVMTPNTFAQLGPSTRNRSNHQPTLVR